MGLRRQLTTATVGDDQTEPEVEYRQRHWALRLSLWLLTLALAIGLFLVMREARVAVNFVRTGSMIPAYYPKDAALTVSPEVVRPEVGSIIVYESEFMKIGLPTIMHRIVERLPDGSWRTKGDNNPKADPWPVSPDQIKAVEVVKIPTRWLQNAWLAGGMLGAIVLMWLWPRRKWVDEVAITGEVSDLTGSSAVLHGWICAENPDDAQAAFVVGTQAEINLETELILRATRGEPEDPDEPVPVWVSVEDLAPETTYHFACIARALDKDEEAAQVPASPALMPKERKTWRKADYIGAVGTFTTPGPGTSTDRLDGAENARADVQAPSS